MEEIWKDIKGYEGLYQVSSLGRVKSLPRDRGNQYSWMEIIKSQRKGIYLSVTLFKEGVRSVRPVHQLVAETFLKTNPEKPFVNHINEIKYDNRLINLEYVTHIQNCNHGTAIERSSEKRRKPVKCSNGEIYEGVNSAAKILGLHPSKISNVCTRKRKTTGGLTFEFI